MILNNTDLWVLSAIPQKRKQKTFNLYPQIALRLNWMLMWEPKCGKWCEKVDTMANYFRCNSSDIEKQCCQLNYWKIAKVNASASYLGSKWNWVGNTDKHAHLWKNHYCSSLLAFLTILYIEKSSLNVIE